MTKYASYVDVVLVLSGRTCMMAKVATKKLIPAGFVWTSPTARRCTNRSRLDLLLSYLPPQQTYEQ